ncbi:DNA ligase D [Oryzifoliimicrobium ureilyticus]|uniref:DNA ligase D n=1 Tax=Oryzifoliimicrobium ureilyticus TaxID=3113724 RepID=UPI0030766603
MALETYNSKRNFDLTPEPRGGRQKSAGNSFVIQKHDARRLHYDFRLEMDGVLKSWAVTKGPSLDPNEKRLAVHVEDHPLSYGDFEGIIPKGQYGGGTVIVWDRGTWKPVGDAKKGYSKGHLEFELDGDKLRGRWHLVRMHPRPGEKRENWLLIKADDEEARPDSAAEILEERPESAKTGRTVEEVAEHPNDVWNSKETSKTKKPGSRAGFKAASVKSSPSDLPKGAKQSPLPNFIEPVLAKLKPKPPTGDRWLHEIKFDGYRLQVRIEQGKVTMLTRSGLDWTDRFGPEMASAFNALDVKTALIDGELVVERSNGASDFSALQHDLSEGRTDRFVFYAFDLLYLDGFDLTSCPLIERKHRLQAVISDGGRLRYSAHFNETGGMVLDHACRLSLEGVISKQRDSKYVSGRGGDWIKSKCAERQEFVIGGYVISSSATGAIGSLALGVQEKNGLRHVGRVGTGFSAEVARSLFARLSKLEEKKSPFADKLTADERRGLVYVKPELVAEIEFRAWSADGNLRHASFRGLREDKAAKDVVQEAKPTNSRPAPTSSVRLTHPDRLYWPDDGVTKQGLVDYYAQVWRFMAPYVVNRPLSLLRLPDGITGKQRFFQKHGWKGMNKSIQEITDPKDRSGPKLLRITDFDGLVALVQSGVLEVHPWGGTTSHWEKPDMITMDLDPGDDVSWAEIISAAEEIKARLEEAGLAAFVKTSGGKGLHVVTPLAPKASWTDVKAFAKQLADEMASDDPAHFIAKATKAGRKGKIFVDYLRNGRGSTAVAPYSTRARPGAPVSMPLAWAELSDDVGPAYFTVANSPARVNGLAHDAWEDFFAAARPLEKKSRK